MNISLVGSSKTHLMQCSGIDTMKSGMRCQPWINRTCKAPVHRCGGVPLHWQFFVDNFSGMTHDNGDMG